MNKKPIGVFDSGLGGLTALRELIKILPNEDFIYFGDTGRVPYGTRSRDTILNYTRQDIAFLKSMDVKMVIAACGTVCSNIDDEFIKSVDLPFISVIEPTVSAATKKSKNKNIGVIATKATIASNSFVSEINRQCADAKIKSKACPLFVPIVEDGVYDKENEIAKSVVKLYLEEFKDTDIDTLILGCTHYPLLKGAIAEYLGSSITLIDSGIEVAKKAADILSSLDMLNESGSGSCEFFVSDATQGFRELASMFLDSNIEEITKVSVTNF